MKCEDEESRVYAHAYWGRVRRCHFRHYKLWLYVELPNTVEGMVHVTTLRGDYYNYVESTYEMVGENSGKSYKLGQTVKSV